MRRHYTPNLEIGVRILRIAGLFFIENLCFLFFILRLRAGFCYFLACVSEDQLRFSVMFSRPVFLKSYQSDPEKSYNLVVLRIRFFFTQVATVSRKTGLNIFDIQMDEIC